jgi:hypothetical protein
MTVEFEEPTGLSRESAAFIKHLENALSSVDAERFQQLIQDLIFCAYNDGYRDSKLLRQHPVTSSYPLVK